MAKPIQTMYFAIKLVAPRVGDKRMLAESSVTTSGTMWVTIHQLEEAAVARKTGARQLRVGPAKQASLIAGVAGHFSAGILDFSDAEDRKCKTLGEAEQLVKKNYKAWLADAYDWFVVPAGIHTSELAVSKAAKPKKTKK